MVHQMARSGPESGDSAECARALDTLATFSRILAIKLYRVRFTPPGDTTLLPCLDHEAMLHARIPPHVAAYIEDRNGHLHEVAFFPAQRRASVDAESTWGECSAESRATLVTTLGERFPAYRIGVRGPQLWRGDRRVTEACRAHVSLRDVLTGPDIDFTRRATERLLTVGSLMEKESRVASWGVRTLTGPMLALAGFFAFNVLGYATLVLGAVGVAVLRYALVGVLGAVFLYFGMKAVQLTGMANRVWKRASEYRMILDERQRRTHAQVSSPLRSVESA